jgi:hypothetical protein
MRRPILRHLRGIHTTVEGNRELFLFSVRLSLTEPTDCYGKCFGKVKQMDAEVPTKLRWQANCCTT